MTDAEKIELLRAKLEETLSENDKLRALVTNLTEGANAHTVLQSLYRNVDLPESLRAKCAIGALNVETPRLEPQPPAIDATCEEIEPLSVVIEKQRRRADAMLAEPRDIEVSPSGAVRILPRLGSNGGNGSDD